MKFFFTEFIKPATHRIGSVVGVYFASLDYFTEGQLASLETASIVMAGYLVDLVVRKAL